MSAIPFVETILRGHKQLVTDVAFNPALKNQFTTSTKEGSIIIWNDYNKPTCYNYVAHSKTVSGVEYSPDGKFLAACSHDGSVSFWLPTIEGECTKFNAHKKPVDCLNFAKAHKTLITGARDNEIKMWDIEQFSCITSFIGHQNSLNSTKFFHNGKIIASCSEDRTTRLWDVNSGQIIQSFENEGSPLCVAPHWNDISVAVGLNTGSVRVYDIRSMKIQQHYLVHTKTSYVDWHPLENILMSSGYDGKVLLIDVLEGRPMYTLKCSEQPVICAKFNSHGKKFIAVTPNDCIFVWNSDKVVESEASNYF